VGLGLGKVDKILDLTRTRTLTLSGVHPVASRYTDCAIPALIIIIIIIIKWSESVSELYRPSDRRLSAKLAPTFADRGCHVVAVTDPYGRILAFLDRSRYLLF
jgi:hypothetical protein